MYLSTKLALSSVIIGSLLASIIQPAQAASIWFIDDGEPLDDDGIFDIKTTVGATQTFTVKIDQANLAVGDTFEFQVGWDTTELGKQRDPLKPGNRIDDPAVTFLNSKENSPDQFMKFRYVVANDKKHIGLPFVFQVLPGLIHNGERDFWLSLDANTFTDKDGNLKDIKLFTSTYQQVEVQPSCCPQPILTPNSLTNYFALIPSSLFSLFFGEPAFAGELNSCSSCSVPEPITGVILGGLAAGAVMMNRKKNKTA